MADGQADGMPPLSDAADRQRWQLVLSAAYKRFCRRVERGADTGIDPYGAESLEEFFAVTTEVFFVAPAELKAESAALYALYADYFRQDPGATP
jgi:Mlc titration factor MtfA (ptsG expression regulator)